MPVDEQMVPLALINKIVKAAVDRAVAKTRVAGYLTGTVDGIDLDTGDVAFMRLDAEATASDPTQSDNWGEPGVIPTTRYGETTTDEQAQVTFQPQGSASAIRTGFAGVDLRVDIDSTQGIMRFLAGDVVVGYLDPTRWELGVPGESLARIDPLGGLRLRDGSDILRAQLSAPEGLILRRPGTGGTGVILADDGLIVIDEDTGERLSITSGTTSATPTPKWTSSENAVGGASHSTPTAPTFGTGDDLDLRFVSASAASVLASSSYTPPASYTERVDEGAAGSSGLTLAASCATRDPAQTTPGAQTFTNTLSGWSRVNGHTVIIRGPAPAFRSASNTGVLTFTTDSFGLTIAAPSGIGTGDIGLAHVSIAGPTIPIGWTVPDGWKQLGVTVAGFGTTHVLSSGIWYKQIEAGDPSTFPVSVNMAAAAACKVQATAVAIQSPYAFPAGLDIRRNNRSMPRGLEASVVQTTSTSVFSASGNTDLDTNTSYPNGVPMLAGRTYVFQLLLPGLSYFGGTVPGSEWQIRLRKDDTTDMGVFAIVRYGGTLNYSNPVNGAFYYVPAADESSRWTVRFHEVSGDAGIQGQASAGAPRRLDIIDMGATF